MSGQVSEATRNAIDDSAAAEVRYSLRALLALRAAHTHDIYVAATCGKHLGVVVGLDLLTSIDFAVLKLTERLLKHGNGSTET